MSQPEPIFVSHLFRELHGHLLVLLRSLTPEDWHRPTVCSAWCVKDIASHLLDGNLRRLSIQRDGYAPPDAPCGFDSHEALVAYLTKLNTDWTLATRRPLRRRARGCAFGPGRGSRRANPRGMPRPGQAGPLRRCQRADPGQAASKTKGQVNCAPSLRRRFDTQPAKWRRTRAARIG
jgi:mycothiol maleylpyruvate isomerase-like protein